MLQRVRKNPYEATSKDPHSPALLQLYFAQEKAVWFFLTSYFFVATMDFSVKFGLRPAAPPRVSFWNIPSWIWKVIRPKSSKGIKFCVRVRKTAIPKLVLNPNSPPIQADVSKITFFRDFFMIFGQKLWIFVLSDVFWGFETRLEFIWRRFWSFLELKSSLNHFPNFEKCDFWNVRFLRPFTRLENHWSGPGWIYAMGGLLNISPHSHFFKRKRILNQPFYQNILYSGFLGIGTSSS